MPDTLTDLIHRLMPLKGRCSNVITDYTRGYRSVEGVDGRAEKGCLGVAKKRKIVTCEETRHSKVFPAEGEHHFPEFECDSANDPCSCTCILKLNPRERTLLLFLRTERGHVPMHAIACDRSSTSLASVPSSLSFSFSCIKCTRELDIGTVQLELVPP